MTRLLSVGLILALLFVAGNGTAQTNTPPLASYLQVVWSTQQECENVSKKKCVYQQCDYLPLGGDPTDCDGDAATGWKPQAESETQPPVQGQR